MTAPDCTHLRIADIAQRSDGHARALTVAAVAGAGGGILASILRLGPQALSGLAGGIAFWAAIAFIVARTGWSRRSSIVLSAVYLSAWLVAYYCTQRIVIVGASSRLFGAAVPWIVLLFPGALMLGIAAATSRRRTLVGDICLALPIAGGVPELLRDLSHGAAFVAVGVATLMIGCAPLVAERRRGVNFLAVAAGFVVAAAMFTSLEAVVSGSRLLGGV